MRRDEVVENRSFLDKLVETVFCESVAFSAERLTCVAFDQELAKQVCTPREIALVPTPKDAAVEVAAILLDGIDLVILGLSGVAVSPSRARAVVARARSKGAVLLVTEGRWDGVDLRIESRVAGYTGLGDKYGRVAGVHLDVAAAGKGFQRRTLRVEIRSDAGSLAWRTVPETQTAGPTRLRAAL